MAKTSIFVARIARQASSSKEVVRPMLPLSPSDHLPPNKQLSLVGAAADASTFQTLRFSIDQRDFPFSSDPLVNILPGLSKYLITLMILDGNHSEFSIIDR